MKQLLGILSLETGNWILQKMKQLLDIFIISLETETWYLYPILHNFKEKIENLFLHDERKLPWLKK